MSRKPDPRDLVTLAKEVQSLLRDVDRTNLESWSQQSQRYDMWADCIGLDHWGDGSFVFKPSAYSVGMHLTDVLTELKKSVISGRPSYLPHLQYGL